MSKAIVRPDKMITASQIKSDRETWGYSMRKYAPRATKRDHGPAAMFRVRANRVGWIAPEVGMMLRWTRADGTTAYGQIEAVGKVWAVGHPDSVIDHVTIVRAIEIPADTAEVVAFLAAAREHSRRTMDWAMHS